MNKNFWKKEIRKIHAFIRKNKNEFNFSEIGIQRMEECTRKMVEKWQRRGKIKFNFIIRAMLKGTDGKKIE